MGRGANNRQATGAIARPRTVTTTAWSNRTSLAQLQTSAEEVLAFEPSRTPGAVSLCYAKTPDGDPIIGLTCQDEHNGIDLRALRTALTGDDPRSEVLTASGRERVLLFDDAPALALSRERLSAQHAHWGEPVLPLHGGRPYTNYVNRYMQMLPSYQGSEVNEFMSMAELRGVARQMGLRGYPNTKQALYELLVNHPDTPRKHPECWPTGCYHDRLVVLRADHGLSGRVMNKLRDAAENGQLAVTSHDAGGGFMLYDARDETPGRQSERQRSWDWHDQQMRRAAPVLSALEERGYGFYAINPRQLRDPDSGELETKFFVNMHSVHGVGQPGGNYTLKELREEKFLADARERARKRALLDAA